MGVTTRFLPPLAALALFAGCAGPGGPAIPQSLSSNSTQIQAATRVVNEHEHVVCGTDHDDCAKIHLVAPLDIGRGFRSMILTLASPTCAHASVEGDPDRPFPLSPQTYRAAAPAAYMVVPAMQNPCAKRDHDDFSGLRPMILVTPTPAPTQVTGNSNYYVVALLRGQDGSLTVSTIDGPANLEGTTLTFDSPVIMRFTRGTYAFYLARKKYEREDR